MDLPLVSCLCITENRVHYLKRAIACFQGQDYPNKELVIVFRDRDVATRQFLEEQDSPQIRSFEVPSAQEVSLGYLRNFSIASAGGDYFCQWDDDDWYHRERITQQITAALMHGKEASALNHLILFDATSGRAYFSFDRPWENTILCKRELFFSGYRYQDLNRTEDTAFMSRLLFANKLAAVTAQPSYIYVYHGGNTFRQAHFDSLYSFSQPLNENVNRLIQEILINKYSFDEASTRLRDAKIKPEFDFFFRWRKHLNEP